MRLTSQLGTRIAAPVEIDREMRDDACLLLVDYLALTTRGAATRSAVAGRAALEAEGVGGGPALVEGVELSSPVSEAALLNGLAAHGLDFDDTYEPASLHPGVVVWPTVMALSDRIASSWDSLIEAAVVGYDAMCLIGRLVGGQVAYERGFHPTGICGVFGAVAASGRMLGLDAARMTDAIGIAASGAAGTLEWANTGAWTKRIHPGQAAAVGIRAAYLAASGFRGPETAIEGELGFLHAYGNGGSEFDGNFQLGEGVRSTSVKFYPSCRYTHGCIDLLRKAQIDHKVPLDGIKSVSCGVLSAGQPLVAEPLDRKRIIRNSVDAQFSMPFTAALALTYGNVTLDDLEHAPDRARELQPLMERIEVHTSDVLEAQYPERWAADVRIELDDGSVAEFAEPAFFGSPTCPPGRADITDKAASLVGRPLAEELAGAVLDHDPTEMVSAALADVRGRSVVAEPAVANAKSQ